jgi:hypothetical protein
MTGEGRVAGLVVAAGLVVGVVLKGAAEKRLAARSLPTASVAGR